MSGIDVFSLPLSPREGFVLSRVDGVSSVEDISIMAGVKQDELLAILDKLAELKAVKLPWAPPKAKPAEPPPKAAKPAEAPKSGAKPAAPPKADAPKSASKQPPAKAADANAAVQRVLAEPVVALYTEAEVAVPADIDDSIKRRILNAFYGSEGKNYYQLLGLPRDADKKAIKAAYFELSKLFHPDSLFGKELGPFKSKMEVVFKRLTEAYEVLGRNQRRKEYDDYLASTDTTHAIQETLEHAATETTTVEAAATFDEPAPAPVSFVPPPAAPEPKQAPKQVDLRPPQTAEQRKQLARERFRRTLTGPAAAASGPNRPTGPNPVITGANAANAGAARPPSGRPERTSARPPGESAERTERRDSAIKGLQQSLRSSALSASRVDPVVALLKRAQDAERAGDLLSAAAALQSALALDSDRKEIQEQYARVSKAVTRNLADNYEKQARYEEKMGKWAAAATSWDRVAEGRPDDVVAARSAAEAMLKAGGDLHRAQRHAQRAVDIAPSDVANVVVLARVFLAAGLRLNARRELEKAVKLDPQNEMIRNLLREAR
jgi:tetratricopeptide (TPR) repeat protein